MANGALYSRNGFTPTVKIVSNNFRITLLKTKFPSKIVIYAAYFLPFPPIYFSAKSESAISSLVADMVDMYVLLISPAHGDELQVF
jgi:hypothetical protein